MGSQATRNNAGTARDVRFCTVLRQCIVSIIECILSAPLACALSFRPSNTRKTYFPAIGTLVCVHFFFAASCYLLLTWPVFGCSSSTHVSSTCPGWCASPPTDSSCDVTDAVLCFPRGSSSAMYAFSARFICFLVFQEVRKAACFGAEFLYAS